MCFINQAEDNLKWHYKQRSRLKSLSSRPSAALSWWKSVHWPGSAQWWSNRRSYLSSWFNAKLPLNNPVAKTHHWAATARFNHSYSNLPSAILIAFNAYLLFNLDTTSGTMALLIELLPCTFSDLGSILTPGAAFLCSKYVPHVPTWVCFWCSGFLLHTPNTCRLAG